MLPDHDEDLLLKEQVVLYNNVATMNDCCGRLTAMLEVFPSPRITWEFEKLGELQDGFRYGESQESIQLAPISGHAFQVSNPVSYGETFKVGPSYSLRGTTNQAVYGDMNSPAHSFTFYITNAALQSENTSQDQLRRVIEDAKTSEQRGSSPEGKLIEASIDSFWKIRLYIRTDAINWLNPRNRNTGTRLTSVGALTNRNFDANKLETFSTLESITLDEAKTRLRFFCWFLSYANGGYIAPLYIKGLRFQEDLSPLGLCACALSGQTTPLERLCESWITTTSDLSSYISCFSTFEKMMLKSFWKETFDFVLDQYFQALQPEVIWQVRASAVGAALERLSYLILVQEETDSNRKNDCDLLFQPKRSKRYETCWKTKDYQNEAGECFSQTEIRLYLLLKRIGLTTDCDLKIVKDFLNLRNNAVHPVTKGMSTQNPKKLIWQAVQWIDEVLLWRLGYGGQYLDRSARPGGSIEPRYNLSQRDTSW